jgi:hypothetical protein
MGARFEPKYLRYREEGIRVKPKAGLWLYAACGRPLTRVVQSLRSR